MRDKPISDLYGRVIADLPVMSFSDTQYDYQMPNGLPTIMSWILGNGLGS